MGEWIGEGEERLRAAFREAQPRLGAFERAAPRPSNLEDQRCLLEEQERKGEQERDPA